MHPQAPHVAALQGAECAQRTAHSAQCAVRQRRATLWARTQNVSLACSPTTTALRVWV